MTSTVVPVFSWLLLILGVSYLLQAETWIRLSKDALANAHKYYPLYLFLLIFGLVIIVEHNKWSMGWNVAITFFGWAMVIKSTVLLLAPQLMEPFIRLIDMSPIKKWIRTAGALLATLGAILVYQNVFNGRFGL
jgi:membrane-bound ClpP family serine protease